MAKTKKSYFCQSCGYESAKWLGKCPACNEWNTFVEEVVQAQKGNSWTSSIQKNPKPVDITQVQQHDISRIKVPGIELNRVLGGGIVPGSLVLIGGEPGIGKSTLLLQLAVRLAKTKTLYISGEESEQQIKLRAERLGNLVPETCFILSETNTENIFKQIEELQPQVVILDSIQTIQTAHIDSPPGSVSQIRECAGQFLRFAKESNIPTILVGHITKDGTLAGPKLLEHMVDVVLQFEGERQYNYRLLRSLKNRFGSTAELGIYQMQSNGLKEVNNPGEILLSQREDPISGIAVTVSIEGARPLLIEAQGLVSAPTFGTPQRSVTGFDLRRLNMLLAVIEKRSGIKVNQQDVFVNIAGGIKIEDTGNDLGIVMAIVSSYIDKAIPLKYCFAGEVGLTGEIRAISRIEQRIAEADKLGFDTIFISKYNTKGLKLDSYGIKVQAFSQIDEVFKYIFS
jgi:DNA repair protein RadA/Sms